MSIRSYLLFSSLNKKKPIILNNRRKAEILLKNQNFTNLLSFTSNLKAKECLRERIDKFKTIQRIEDARIHDEYLKNYYRKLYDLDEELVGKEEISQTDEKNQYQKQQEQACKSVAMFSKETLNERLKELLGGLGSEERQLMERYKPQSIMTSIYTPQIYPSRLYKFYLSMKGKKSLQDSSNRNVFAYYVTRKQQILMERTFVVQARSQSKRFQVALKGVYYILADAWVNGMRNIEINCDNKGLFYIWQDLIKRGIIKDEQGNFKLKKNNQSESDEQQSKPEESQEDQQQDDAEQSSKQTTEVQSQSNDQKQNKQQNNSDSKKKVIFQITQSEGKQALQKLNFVTLITQEIDEMDDFADETIMIENCLQKSRSHWQKPKTDTLRDLLKPMQSVKLKLLSTDQNKNAIDLVDQRLKKEKAKTDEYKKKRKQLEQTKKQAISQLKPTNFYSNSYYYDDTVERTQKRLEAEFRKNYPQFQEQ